MNKFFNLKGNGIGYQKTAFVLRDHFIFFAVLS